MPRWTRTERSQSPKRSCPAWKSSYPNKTSPVRHSKARARRPRGPSSPSWTRARSRRWATGRLLLLFNKPN